MCGIVGMCGMVGMVGICGGSACVPVSLPAFLVERSVCSWNGSTSFPTLACLSPLPVGPPAARYLLIAGRSADWFPARSAASLIKVSLAPCAPAGDPGRSLDAEDEVSFPFPFPFRFRGEEPVGSSHTPRTTLDSSRVDSGPNAP